MPDPHLSKVADQLQQLRTAFSRPPPKHHSAGSTYPFENFVIDDEWLELTGSVQGSVNHTLEVAFGSRHNGGPIEFKSHGPDLAAVVDVLSAHITGEGGENPILIKWIVDLHRAAVHAAEQDPSEDSKKRERKPSAKQEIINQEESTNANKKKKKAAAKARTKKAKERTEEDFLWDPLDLRPAKRNDSTVGRKPDPLLDKLTEFVEAISDPEVKHWRCIAHSSGCQHSQADPRSSLRVFSHAVDCSFLDPELVQRAAEASISRSLGAQIEALNAVETASKGKDDPQPSVYAEARATGREKRSLNFNHLVLQAVCGLSLPPSILDTKHWRSLIDFLDPYLDRKSGSHMAHALIPAEAARVRQLSIKALQKHRNLTLTFDGATSRRNQSIYTIHATTPDTREAHLLYGHEATGKSHTGEHLKEVLLKVTESIGAQHLSAITSDNTGNTRLARELVASIYPWLIILPDCCHHMNNAAKDICDLEVFADANLKLRALIKFFRMSSYATHHLTAWRRILGITKGLVSIGNTRFLTLYYAIASLLPCLGIMVDLVKSGVIAANNSHPLFWLRDKQAVRAFEDTLRQEMALLEPLARSVKCLESSASTVADVALFWLATQATLKDLSTDPLKRDELMLTEELIANVRRIMNARFAQMMEGPNRRMYLTALFLNPLYLGSNLFTHKNANPLAATISIPSTSVPARNAPDSDLRAMLPQYELSGAYLGELLVHEMNANRAQDIFGRFSTGEEIVDEFRIQYTNYVRQVSPFDRYLDAPTPLQYWEKLSRHYDAQILALLGIKLYSVVPNSMAEERTVSNFTKLNAPDRGRQKASTLVHMTQIRQHAQREENQGSPAVAPTVRFRDMSDLLKSAGKVAIDLRGTNIPTSANAGDIVPVANGSDSVVHDFVVDAWEQEAGFDEKIEPAEGGAMDGFEVEAEGINLGEPLLLDLLSDEPVLGASLSGSASTKKRPAPVDTSASSAQGLRKKFAPESFKF
ncbi:hypothetical protein V565_199460 [Rhizoctonia solani 123E]|uniref:Uncharacterized protein n=1 Tax=Rhizoctonia solani 123E TaxID=1423351 RepID=A0A074S8Q7_9AGAM|nr:hypothetical protein V565_199460 [Rhizoctonia solani 123E]